MIFRRILFFQRKKATLKDKIKKIVTYNKYRPKNYIVSKKVRGVL